MIAVERLEGDFTVSFGKLVPRSLIHVRENRAQNHRIFSPGIYPVYPGFIPIPCVIRESVCGRS